MALERVVVLMLENRSFDHLLGYLDLPGVEGIGAGRSNPTDLGWGGLPAATITTTPAVTPAAYVTAPDPPHEFADVTLQLFGQSVIPEPATPTNQGFIMAYARSPSSNGQPVGLHVAQNIMACFTPAQVPVLAKLARNYTVCDHWFASMPGPTWPNRFFVHAATSGGLAESPSSIASIVDGTGVGGFTLHTIYENLDAANVSWAIYHHDFAQSRAIRSVNARSNRLLPFDAFLDAARHGTLPQYSFIEPRYFSLPTLPPANDMHPAHDVRNGERLIAQVYDALRSGDAAQWQSTLFIVVFDEHGGFFDHVPPPAAVSPDNRTAANGFRFDRLGVRVPAILVSPLTAATVSHTVFDHTSILATLKGLFNLPNFLTARDRAANPLQPLLLGAPRPDAELPRNLTLLCSEPPASTANIPLTDYQKSLVSLAAAIHAPAPNV